MYKIMAQKNCGKIFTFFDWTDEKEEGIKKARDEIKKRNIPVILLWAQPAH